ncbi:unnamed protein product [Oppiella nova]|uniref:Potassium channel domain-containing protein n=1 Tax=Oppiella nova TaxID=334625 RepID=A0A7R9LLP2_9ACAR|nr:unnamed protein product [Oppiella nova]CAG2164863.1 unnamed protein product [Oppiella nova]
MSSDEQNIPQNSSESVLPVINESQSEPNVENDSESREKCGENKSSDEMTANDSQTTLCAPPRRKFTRIGSLRRTYIPDSTDTTDTNDTQLMPRCYQKPICESLPQTHDTLNDDNNVTLVVTQCEPNSANDSKDLSPNVDNKCKHLREDCSECVSTDPKGTHSSQSCIRRPNAPQNGLNPFEERLMRTMRRWKSRWFTSDEAKATRKRRFNRILYYLKVFLTHLFSTTGLCLLVIAYTCVGAFIFTYLESKHEVQTQNDIEKQRQEFAVDLWNQTNNYNVLYPEKWINETQIRLKKFEEIIVKAVREDGYGGSSEQWTFSGALLYSVTVITTIGYGNVTCKTDLGRIVTMIYALLGIPVMFLCLANLGNLMAQTFRFSYKRLCCLCFCCCEKVSTKYNHKHKPQKEKIELKNCDKNFCADSEKKVEVIFSENDDQKVRSIIALTASTPPTTSVTSSQASSPLRSFPSNPLHSDLNQQNNDLVVIQETIEGNDDSDRVPIWLVILLVISYIMAGAFMFSLWEEGWGPLEGAYFCFTTLTTIGFGDLVPGSAKYSDNKEEQTKFIICCAYLIVGLSLLAMSFNLVQEEIVIRFKELGKRMGIIPQHKTEFNKTNSV